jgi:hypothetical protein
MILNSSQVTGYLYNAGFKGVNLSAALKICYCESGFNTNAHNTTGEDSRGLMQINVDAHPNYANRNLFDPQINCNTAYEIFTQSGKNFKAWTCARKLNLENPLFLYGTAIAFLGIALYISAANN